MTISIVNYFSTLAGGEIQC